MKIHRGNFESNLYFLRQTKLLNKQQQILEIGAGSGALTAYLKKHGFNILGTEIDQNKISAAKKHFKIKLRRMAGEKLSLPSRKYDLVLSFDVLEHIPDTNQHLQEVRRVLKTGGYYLFATPNKYTNIPFSILKDKSLTLWKKYHCSLYSYSELKKVLTANNFKADFMDIPVVNDFFKHKMSRILGKFSESLLKVINPDKFPLAWRTNFYVVAKKIK